jgi:hypothetical protein
MLAQMAATAGSVAVGSTIGHGLSSMLFGGGGQATAAAEAAPVQQQNTAGVSCEIQAKGALSIIHYGSLKILTGIPRLHQVP